jgi:hypothetical protein
MSATKSQKSVTVDPMTVRHQELIAARMSAEGAGPRMKSMKTLRAHEVEMSVSGIPYVAFTPPAASKSHNMSPDQLLRRVADIRRVIADENTPKTTVATASRLLEKLIEECKVRGIDVPDAS